MTNQLATTSKTDIMEQVLISGDLSKLTPEQRMTYYLKTCESLGLNPYTKPFDYITLNGKLILYARKDAADQLRKIHEVSIDNVDIKETDTQFITTVKGHDKTGRSDVEIGVVNKGDMRGDTANAMMKCVTKGKRRFTLSICGLGMLDETEIETIPDARPVVVNEHGEIAPGTIIVHDIERPTQQPAPKPANNGSFNPVVLLVQAEIADNNFEASNILNKYAPKEVKTNPDTLKAWGKLYRAWRDLGSQPEAAAKNATEGVPTE